MPDTLTLLGYLGAAIGVCVVIPQIARILRNPDTPGVSAGFARVRPRRRAYPIRV